MLAGITELSATATKRFEALEEILAGAMATMEQIRSAAGSVETELNEQGTQLAARMDALAGKIRVAIDAATKTLGEAQKTFASANAVLDEEVPRLVADLDAATLAANRMIDTMEPKAVAVLDEATGLARSAGTTLANLDTTLAGANTTLDQIGAAAASTDTLMRGEAVALVGDLRQATGTANELLIRFNGKMATDLELALTDVRRAVGSAREVIEGAGKNLTSLTGNLDAMVPKVELALDTATTTFANANATLASIEKLMGSTQTLVDRDGAPMLSDLSSAAANVNVAAENAATFLATDVPVVARDLRLAVGAANSLLVNLDGAVAEARPELLRFTRAGLPQLLRFIQEVRADPKSGPFDHTGGKRSGAVFVGDAIA